MSGGLANRGLSAVAGYLSIQKIPPPGSEDWEHAKMLAVLTGVTRDTRAALKPVTDTYAKRRRFTEKLKAEVTDAVDKRGGWTDDTDERVLAYLRRGADPGVVIRGWGSVLYRACLADRPNVVTALLDAGADLNPADDSYVPLLAAFRSLPMTEMLLARGADPNLGRVALSLACEVGSLGAVRALIRHGADPDAGCPPPLLAISGNHREIREELLRAGANPNPRWPVELGFDPWNPNGN